jgi:transposase-like protein
MPINSMSLTKSINSNNSRLGKIRKKHSKEFKFKVALEALKEQKTITSICREFGVHETQVKKWKKQLKEGGALLFEEASPKAAQSELETQIRKLNEYIGELSVENQFFKKNLNF